MQTVKPTSCREEHCGVSEVLRLLPGGFTGQVTLHFAGGIVGSLRIVEFHDRETLKEIAGRLREGRETPCACPARKAAASRDR